MWRVYRRTRKEEDNVNYKEALNAATTEGFLMAEEMVAKKIKAMKDNKSPGVDGIPPKRLMETVEQISIPLARVFNLSLKEGIVPFEWKEANVIPLSKKGLRNKSENYRAVSLTSVICKLFERLIKDHMMDFLFRHK